MAKLWKYHLALTVLLVVLTFFFGVQREGRTTRLGSIGITTLQPSEFLKISFVITFAYHLSKVRDTLNKPKTLGLLLLHAGAISGLIVIQGGLRKRAGIYFFIAACMPWIVAGAFLEIYSRGAGGAAGRWGCSLNFLFEEQHRMRVLLAFNPDLIPQPRLSAAPGRRALGSGLLFGQGCFGQSHQRARNAERFYFFPTLVKRWGWSAAL